MQTKIYIIKCYEFGEVYIFPEAYVSEVEADKRAADIQKTHGFCYVEQLQLNNEGK
jgi:hypothetical protein